MPACPPGLCALANLGCTRDALQGEEEPLELRWVIFPSVTPKRLLLVSGIKIQDNRSPL